MNLSMVCDDLTLEHRFWLAAVDSYNAFVACTGPDRYLVSDGIACYQATDRHWALDSRSAFPRLPEEGQTTGSTHNAFRGVPDLLKLWAAWTTPPRVPLERTQWRNADGVVLLTLERQYVLVDETYLNLVPNAWRSVYQWEPTQQIVVVQDRDQSPVAVIRPMELQRGKDMIKPASELFPLSEGTDG